MSGIDNWRAKADSGGAAEFLPRFVLAVLLDGPGIRISEWAGGMRTVRVALTDGGLPAVGAVVAATSSDATRIAIAASATSDGAGIASFAVQFKAGGRALLTFAHESGATAQVLAVARTQG